MPFKLTKFKEPLFLTPNSVFAACFPKLNCVTQQDTTNVQQLGRIEGKEHGGRSGITTRKCAFAYFSMATCMCPCFICCVVCACGTVAARGRSEEHTSELQSLMRISYAVFCLKKKKNYYKTNDITDIDKYTF